VRQLRRRQEDAGAYLSANWLVPGFSHRLERARVLGSSPVRGNRRMVRRAPDQLRVLLEFGAIHRNRAVPLISSPCDLAPGSTLLLCPAHPRSLSADPYWPCRGRRWTDLCDDAVVDIARPSDVVDRLDVLAVDALNGPTVLQSETIGWTTTRSPRRHRAHRSSGRAAPFSVGTRTYRRRLQRRNAGS
jgi:hypothetical protein